MNISRYISKDINKTRNLQDNLLFSTKRFIFAPVNFVLYNMKSAFLSRINYIFLLFVSLIAISPKASAQNFRDQSDLQWVAVPVLDRSAKTPAVDWLYKLGDTAYVDVQVLLHGAPLNSDVEYTVGLDCLEKKGPKNVALCQGSAVFHSNRGCVYNGRLPDRS